MFRLGAYEFKVAETAEEFDQVHRLNYRTFVREIPQHPDPGTGRLVDKFHSKNTYLICRKGTELVGMLSAHDRPPFSVADRLPDPSVLTRPGVRPVEIRLLAVVPEERKGPVLAGLVWALYRRAAGAGYTHFVISGVAEQADLYAHLGFEPLGPAVGVGRASFVPMWLPLARLAETMGRSMRLWERRLGRQADDKVTRWQGDKDEPPRTLSPCHLVTLSPNEPVCLLPGPVAVAPRVTEAFRRPPVYHRADEFVRLHEAVCGRLADLAGGKAVGLFVGSGTLANEAVAATLAAGPGRDRGLVLVNGEFGDRLRRQAARWGLAPRVLRWDWGRPWQLDEVEAVFRETPAGGWVWGVHHETSTGVLNDLPGLVALAARYGQRVCADCVSSLGAVPVDLSGVSLAAGASGKGLGSYAGLAFVFADPAALAGVNAEAVPSYVDAAAAVAATGPRFTVPSPLVAALDAALEPLATPEGRAGRFARVRELGAYLRDGLRAAGLEPLAPAAVACPAVVTFAPPAGMSSAEFVARCRGWGYLVGGQSGYLAERRLVQFAVMGDLTREQLAPLVERLAAA